MIMEILKHRYMFPIVICLLNLGACIRWTMERNVGLALYYGLGVATVATVTFIVGK
jgi:hypothetical protein